MQHFKINFQDLRMARLSDRVNEIRMSSSERVKIRLAPPPIPVGCGDVYLDEQWIGGMFLTDKDCRLFLEPAVVSLLEFFMIVDSIGMKYAILFG